MKGKNKSTSFVRGIHRVSSFHAKGVPFSKLYLERRTWVKYLLVALIGVGFGILGFFLLKNVGGYNYGLACLMQGIARLSTYLISKSGAISSPEQIKMLFDALFWVFVLLGNLPLLIFAGIKVGKRFALLTTTFLVVSTITGVLLGLSNTLNNFYLFGNPILENNATNPSQWIEIINDWNIQMLPFAVPSSVASTYSSINYAKPFFLILSTAVYAIVAGIIFGMLFILGGSTGGTDIISIYFSIKKNKSISTVFFFLNLGFVIVGSTIGSFLPAALECPECRHFYFWCNANLIGTIISLAIFTFVFKKSYPKDNKYQVKIHSAKANKICSALKENNYPQQYKLSKDNTIKTICATIDLPLLLDYINNIDDKATYVVTDVKFFGGQLSDYLIGSDK